MSSWFIGSVLSSRPNEICISFVGFWVGEGVTAKIAVIQKQCCCRTSGFQCHFFWLTSMLGNCVPRGNSPTKQAESTESSKKFRSHLACLIRNFFKIYFKPQVCCFGSNELEKLLKNASVLLKRHLPIWLELSIHSGKESYLSRVLRIIKRLQHLQSEVLFKTELRSRR